MSDLPPNWAEAPLGELVSFRKGKKPTSFGEESGKGFLPYLDILAIEKKVVERYAKADESRLLDKDEVLVVWDGARSGWVGLADEGAIGSTLMALKSYGIEQLYLYYFLQGQFKSINSNTRGTGIPHVDPEAFWKLDLPIAPINEQRRIVERIVKLTDKEESCQKRLERIPILLKRFRQSVLAAACSGKLTEDWREEEVGDADSASLCSGSKEIPRGWQKMELGQLAKLARGRFSIRPRNDPRYYGGAFPFIQIGDLPREGGNITNHKQTLNEEGLAVSRMFPKGTALVAIVGATIGNTGILTFDSCCPDSLVAIQGYNESHTQFIEYYLRSQKDQIRARSYSSGGQPNINLGSLVPLLVPAPPNDEVGEIVARVEQLLSLADQIETHYQSAKAQVDKITPSILAKAFRGELVPQDPNDEPADKLLERIRAARSDRQGGEVRTVRGRTRTTVSDRLKGTSEKADLSRTFTRLARCKRR